MKPTEPISLMKPKEVAALLRVSDSLLKQWRAKGIGPVFTRVSKQLGKSTKPHKTGLFGIR